MPLCIDLQEDKVIKEETFKIYSIFLRGENIEFDSRDNSVEFDAYGDILVNLKLDDKTLLDTVAECDIISYLEDNGYVVTQED